MVASISSKARCEACVRYWAALGDVDVRYFASTEEDVDGTAPILYAWATILPSTLSQACGS
jgi:hypothetical protein